MAVVALHASHTAQLSAAVFESLQTSVDVVQTVKAQIIKANTALKLRARARFTDRAGVTREVGEEWLVRKDGAYLPAVEEEVLGFVEAKVLTEKDALHLELKGRLVSWTVRHRQFICQKLVCISKC